MFKVEGKRKYKGIAGELFLMKCINHIIVNAEMVKVYRHGQKATNENAEIKIKEQRKKNPDTPVDIFMFIEIEEKKDGLFDVIFWSSL
jgi:hypothetical protein